MPHVLVFSYDGELLLAWNTSTLDMPHGIFLANADTNPTVWVTDVGKGEIFVNEIVMFGLLNEQLCFLESDDAVLVLTVPTFCRPIWSLREAVLSRWDAAAGAGDTREGRFWA